MGLNTAASLSFSQINSAAFFTNGNLGVNTTSPGFNLDVNGTINISGTSTLQNITGTNISATNFVTTSVTSGLLAATNIIGANISAGTLSATTITGSNLSLSGDLIIGGTLTSVNVTSTNIVNTNISTGTLNASNTSSFTNTIATNISTGILIASTGISTGTINATGTSSLANTTITNISSTNLVSTSITTAAVSATNITVGALISSIGITTGTINLTSLLTLTGTVSILMCTTGSTTNSIYQEFINGLNHPGRIGLDGTGYLGINTGAFTISAQSTKPLLFATNGVIRSTITSNGNFGIATATPAYTLDVAGTINASTSITTAALSATNISAGTVRASAGITIGSFLATNSITTGNVRLNDNPIYLRIAGNTSHGIQYNSTVDGPKIWGDLGGTLTVVGKLSTSTLAWNNSGKVGIGGITSLGNNLSINTTTDAMTINSDAYNTLLVYEDMQDTTVKSGILAGANVSYLQNNYVQLTNQISNARGQWYWNMNPGNAFTTDYETSNTGDGDGHTFFWGGSTAPATNTGAQEGTGYSLYFDEFNGNIRLYYNLVLLTSVSVGLRNTNWVKIRIVYQRNVIRVYYNGSLQINYKDTARHLNYSNNYMGFTAWCGGGASSAHRIRELRIQKLVEGLWNYTSQTSGNIMFNGNVGINTSAPTQALDTGNTMVRGYLYSTSVPNSTTAVPLARASANFGWNGGSGVIVVKNAYNCSVVRTGTGTYSVTFTNSIDYYVVLTGFQRMGTNDFVSTSTYTTSGFIIEFGSDSSITDNLNSISFVVL